MTDSDEGLRSTLRALRAGPLRREDEAADEDFYSAPRLVTHIDNGAIAAVTQLYREYFPPDGAVLDLMSSWISHLPAKTAYRRVAGLGMNAVELGANERLTEWVVHNLNREPRLPYGEAEFDAAGLCVSVDYLTQPVAVLRDVGRVLRPGAPLVITFSNRCFPTKAVSVWHTLDDVGRRRQLGRHHPARPQPALAGRPAVCGGGEESRTGRRVRLDEGRRTVSSLWWHGSCRDGVMTSSSASLYGQGCV
jgi:SAM-dependent methyltransferase